MKQGEMITVVVACDGNYGDYHKSIQSLKRENVQIILFATADFGKINIEPTDGIMVLETLFHDRFEGYQSALQLVKTTYVQFCVAGDSPLSGAYGKVCAAMGKDSPDILYVMGEAYKGKAAKPVQKQLKNGVVDLREEPWKTVLTFSNVLFPIEKVRTLGFDRRSPLDNGLFFVWNALCCCEKACRILDAVFDMCTDNLTDLLTVPAVARNKAWYFETLSDGMVPVLKKMEDTLGNVPMAVQYSVYYSILRRFDYNSNTQDQHVCDGRVDEFYGLVGQVMKMLSDRVIFDVGRHFECAVYVKILLMKLKYDGNFQTDYAVDIATGECGLLSHGIVYEKFGSQRIVVDVINQETEGYVLECSFLDRPDREAYELHAMLSGTELKITDTVRYASLMCFGQAAGKMRTFLVEVPYSLLKRKQQSFLEFYGIIHGYHIPLRFDCHRYPGRISVHIKDAYWDGGHYLLKYVNEYRKLRFIEKTRIRHFEMELRYLRSLFQKGKKKALVRILYWVTSPYFKGKRIWVTFDKLYKAGDNGEYFYRYASKQKDGIVMGYIASKGYPDTKRMQKQGVNLLFYGSLKHRFYFLHASMVVATHSHMPSFSGFSPKDFWYVQDLFKANVVCIQHGLTVQELSHALNAQRDNTRRFYCASPYEIENLSQPDYGYYDKSALELVGVARYDGLVNNDQKQILISPTWRSYISMPISNGTTRPYSDQFKQTTYFKVFNSLIQNKKMIETAKKTGYKIIYLLHPVISSQLKDFTPGEGVEVRSPVTTNYEEILTQSSLMVTDYSGIQFDFAYMRKPILYYHTPKLPPHYEEAGFYYDTMGFGSICDTEEKLVEELCGYMETQCAVNDFYKKRMDKFFKYNDRNNCERIYKRIKEFDEERRLLKGYPRVHRMAIRPFYKV